MSFLRRLFQRKDTTPRRDDIARLVESALTTGNLSQFDYVSYLRKYKVWNVDAKEHREYQAQRNAVAYRIIHLSDHIFAHGFDIVDAQEDKKEEQFDPLLEEMEQLQWRRAYQLACQYERTHGYSAILRMREGDNYTNMEGPPSPNDVRPPDALIPISAMQIKQIDLDMQTGEPERVKIQFASTDQGGYGTSRLHRPVDIHGEHFQFINVRPIDRSPYGVSLLKPCWPQLVWYHSIQEAMSHQSAKFAAGLLTFPMSEGADEKAEDDIIEQMKNAQFRMGITYPETQASEPKFLAPPLGQTPLVSYLDNLIGDVAIVSELPKTYLLGTEAGAVTGSVINNRQVFASIRKEQDNYEQYVLDLMQWLSPGFMEDFKGVKFKWRILYSLGRMEEAELSKSQAVADKDRLLIHSVNELRKEKGLDPVPGGDLPLSIMQMQWQFNVGQQGGGGQQEEGADPETAPKPRPQAPQESPARTDKYELPDRLDQLLKVHEKADWVSLRDYAHTQAEGGVRKACKHLGISTTTYYKWNEKHDSN